ncbi:hypothetical protein Hypma_003282 [Hypsizygus marmoreus]|uniref:NACHT domain-containing protein n=1 Tax=Hypsizygus marmoreus TaxID=39966 RepID=A0A369K4M1_HYPMA|nr:hypothetical protein Hypma_003282 [Hypsizygus marmoreus]
MKRFTRFYAKLRKPRSKKQKTPAPPQEPSPVISSPPADASGTATSTIEGDPSPDSRSDVIAPEPAAGSQQPQESKPTGPQRALGPIKLGLGLAKEAAAVFGPLQSVVGSLLFLVEHHEKWMSNKEDIKRVVKRLDSLMASLQDGANNGNTSEDLHRQELQECGHIICDLGDLLTIVNRKLEMAAQTLEAMKSKNYLTASENAKALSGLIEDIRGMLQDYQTKIQGNILSHTSRLMESEDLRILQLLPHALKASHRSVTHKSCLKGTRVDVLEKIEAWSEEPSSLSVYWLNGHAGSGKSTIAQSFCERAFADGHLGASFFCSRDYTDRSDLRMIFPTLSYQLACAFPAFREQVVSTLRKDPDIGHNSLSNQLTSLLIIPLQKSKLSTVIVIDALDECKETEPASVILSLLARYIRHIPLVKFFVTGRPEPPIREGFRLKLLEPLTTIFVLHNVEVESVDRDIELFFRTRLLEAVLGRSDVDLSIPWPSDDEVKILTTKSSGLFIFAATAVSFIVHPANQPQERLSLLKRIPNSSLFEGQLGIDSLYFTVLKNGYADMPDNGEYAVLRSILASIVLAFNPLSKAMIASLLHIEHSITSALRLLHAVLHIPQLDNEPITVYHKSFPDFITCESRCVDPRFFIDPAVYHPMLAVHCLEIMTERSALEEYLNMHVVSGLIILPILQHLQPCQMSGLFFIFL